MSGGGNKTEYVTTQSSTSAPAYAQPFLEFGLQEAKNNYQSGSPSYFPGQGFVDFSPQTEQALQGVETRALAGSPLQQAGVNQALATVQGNYLSTGNPIGAAQSSTADTLSGAYLAGNPTAAAQGQIGSAIAGGYLPTAANAAANNSITNTLGGQFLPLGSTAAAQNQLTNTIGGAFLSDPAQAQNALNTIVSGQAGAGNPTGAAQSELGSTITGNYLQNGQSAAAQGYLSNVLGGSAFGANPTSAAQENLAATIRGDYLGRANPYRDAAIEAAMEPVIANTSAAFSGGGRFNSGLFADALAKRGAQVAGQIGYQDYGAERAAQERAVNQALAQNNTMLGLQSNAANQALAQYEAERNRQMSGVGTALSNANANAALQSSAAGQMLSAYDAERARQLQGSSQALGAFNAERALQNSAASQALGAYGQERALQSNASGQALNAFDAERARQANAANLAYNAYGQERGLQQQMIGQAPSLAASDYADLAQLMNVGAAREQMAQNQLNDQINRYNFEQNLPATKLQQYMANVAGGTVGSTGTTSQPVFSNPTSQTLGALSTLAGIGQMAFNPLTGFLR